MPKSLKDILSGVRSSKEEPLDISDREKSSDIKKVVSKLKVQKHADRVGNGDDVYNASKIKQDKHPRQSPDVYEETINEISAGKLDRYVDDALHNMNYRNTKGKDRTAGATLAIKKMHPDPSYGVVGASDKVSGWRPSSPGSNEYKDILAKHGYSLFRNHPDTKTYVKDKHNVIIRNKDNFWTHEDPKLNKQYGSNPEELDTHLTNVHK